MCASEKAGYGLGGSASDDPPGSAGSPFFYLDEGEGRFKEGPCPLEAHRRAKLRLAAGGKAKKHPTPPDNPVPPGKKWSPSQPISKIRPLVLETVGSESASSQPVVNCHIACFLVVTSRLPHL